MNIDVSLIKATSHALAICGATKPIMPRSKDHPEKTEGNTHVRLRFKSQEYTFTHFNGVDKDYTVDAGDVILVTFDKHGDRHVHSYTKGDTFVVLANTQHFLAVCFGQSCELTMKRDGTEPATWQEGADKVAQQDPW